jgi:hypothetical protein
MVLERYEIHNQEALITAIIEARKDMERFRAVLVEAFTAKYSDF